MEEEMEICSNCKREIRSVNYVTHSVHCHRNIVICKKCKEPVPRAELDEHDAAEHGFVACKDCGAQMENSAVPAHMKNSCPCRIISCVFCELELKAIEAVEHENYCGTRTEKCPECGEFVMLKYKTLHVDSNHGFLKLEDEPGPPPSWEAPAPKPPPKVSEPCRPILKSAIRGPASSLLTSHVKRAVPNTVRFAPIEPPASPKVEKEERQIKFANKIGAEVKPIMSTVAPTPVVKEVNEITKVSPIVERRVMPVVKKDEVTPVNDIEADRLLAFKLAQEEMEMAGKTQLDGILQQRRKAVEASRKGEDKVVEKSPEKMLRPQRSVEFVQEKSKSPTPKRESPQPPAQPPPEVPTYPTYEDVQIPCEFCEELIPAKRLLIHQTGCRPDITSYMVFKQGKPKRSASTDEPENTADEAAHAAPPPKSLNKNLIPCDLCDTSIPADKFIQHQLACEIKHLPGRIEKPKALVMPLSGRTLKASKSIDESILPALENLEKEADKEYKSGLRNCRSANDLKALSGPSQKVYEEDPEEMEKKAKQGAVPKQKPKSIKKYRAPQPPQMDKAK